MKTAYLSLLLALSFTVFGQRIDGNINNIPSIEVTGVAELEIIPDEIYIAINIVERHEGKTKLTIEEQEAQLKKALQSINVPIENLYLSDATSKYVKVRWSKKDVVANASYILKVESATTLGKVFEQLETLKIVNAYIERVNHSKIKEYKKEVKIMAIQAAKSKADYLLESIGEETGSAIVIRELDRPQYFIDGVKVRGNSFKAYESGKTGFENEEIQYEKIKLVSNIFAKFEIE